MKINITGKCSDTFGLTVQDDFGEELIDYVGYAPALANVCDGDYIDMEIDNDTGKIIGWVPLTKRSIKAIKEELMLDEDENEDEE